ncbi:MAG: 1-acyl-sn-glycerol-3-phosphate acyltransferase [Holophagaceae bacterium]|nr:1-acyl-sn-glycerol-3-phosphate acyltransferase [Holophagaceae bacterium]
MKYLRSTTAWGYVCAPWAIVSVVLTGMAILTVAPFMGGTKAFFAIGKLWARQILWLCGASWSSEGWESVPEEIRNGSLSAIFMSNHESHLDPPLLMGAIPVPAVYIAKKEVRRMPFVGWAAWVGGMIFIDRGKSERAARSMSDAAEQIRRGKNVVIFPEGTRTINGQLGRFKKGGFGLALKAEVPIVPLATVGGWDILPKGAMRFKPGNIQVVFGKAVFPNNYPTREALMGEVERQIREMIATIRPKTQNV